jgi:hypothetical protein
MLRTFYRTFSGTTVALVVFGAIQVTAQQSGALTTPRSAVARATPARLDTAKILPGTRPNVFSAIQGNALDTMDGALANAAVRLRDARFGQIITTQTTDQSGLFAFRTVDPGSYIVEVMGADQSSVLAASQVLNVGPGEAVSAVVKLPFKMPALAGILGTSTPSAGSLTAQAASAGILATEASGAPTCDNLRQ